MLARSSLKSRRQNAGRPAEKSAPGFLQWLRGRPCYLAGHRNGGCGAGDPPRRSPVEAAHVDHGGDKGLGTKASDRHAIPLCQKHHDEQGGRIGSFRQRGGWRSFELKYGFSATQVASDYWRAWLGTPMGRTWEGGRG